MAISVYDVTVPVFLRGLGTLSAVLEKGRAHADTEEIPEVELVNARLAPDMLTLAGQVQRASDTATVILEEVKVPKENVIAGEGDGFKVAMMTFDRTRPDIAAGACGLMRRAMDESARYALERKTFGVAIAQHQAVQFMIAEMAMKYEATRLLMLKAAWMIDQHEKSSIVSSYAKCFGADAAMQVATDAVQVFGGNGYMKDYPVEKLMRDAKILQIYEGTSQVQRMVIAKNILTRG